MKKLIFALLIAFSSAMVFTSCTEEEIVPATQQTGPGNSGGNGSGGCLC